MQQVRLPAGADVVTFSYRPPHWLVASVLSEGSSLLLVVLGGLAVVTSLRRRRRGRRPAGAASAGAAGATEPSVPLAGTDAGPRRTEAPVRDPYVVSRKDERA